ncbi:serine hydrolase domain-containing protein [Flavihumibacter sp. CACIAM 22H1]|uniref:serine hydrolase domain-containing protein n=1 Tax=Flavihumibacter sp. CACIAM 22H1 TaxID=1812911 RepID=UPI0007A9055D|nr:serine hydrolase domain-containing protein [Flavihumibacter sp. CACIAM 22H1]KYP14346.1 MAG: hypothetical protein A1D16_11480 [Flavihumibacter sp. CACIAM 22H1]
MRKLTLSIITVLLAFSASAQSPGFDSLLQHYADKENFSGVAILAVNGQLKAIKAVGGKPPFLPVKPTARFKIASMTKVFTAVLIMKLVEEGRLHLDSTIGTYYAAYKGPARNQVTIHQLLTYSSGIENILDPLGMTPYQTKLPLHLFIERYCSGKLVDSPGTKSAYSNTEYIILHAILEQVTGKSYETILKQVILQPLGLKNTGIAVGGTKIPGLVPSYIYDDSLKVFTAEEAYLPDMYFGAGFLYSNAKDLVLLDAALFNNLLLSKATTRQLLKIHESLGNAAYGFWGASGWGDFSEPFYYRTGGILGSCSNWIHTMKTGKTIVVLSNSNATNLYELSGKIYQLPAF